MKETAEIIEIANKMADENQKDVVEALSRLFVSLAECLYDDGYRKQSEGEWEKRTFIIFDSEKVGYRCSECNTTWDAPTNYCPNCGAKMKGGA